MYIIGNRYYATAVKDLEDYSLLVFTGYKRSTNPITNPNHAFNHYIMRILILTAS